MLVRALVEYKVLGDDEYIYIESFEVRFKEDNAKLVSNYWRGRVLMLLAQRKIKIGYIKDLSVDYVRD
jgi:hypothetical protein